ncbi:MAG: hypothetical protein KMY54_01255 [Erysipelothrix sp.]|nr:hypothetical protein [Erysipelothrix sp.]
MTGKMYVDVIVHHQTDGKIKPLVIIWKNGVKYSIDKVTQVVLAASLKSGGAGVRYTCIIGGARRYLFLEDDRWFIEKGD